jgi:hypothetical protein
MLLRRFASLLAVLFGSLGIVACGAGGYAVWQAAAHLDRANRVAFDTADRGLGYAETRLKTAQDRLREAKTATDEVARKVGNWSAQKAVERTAGRLDLGRKADTLTDRLRAADVWMETSSDSLTNLRQLLELAKAFGAKVDPATIDELVARLATARGAVQHVSSTITEIREFANAPEGPADDSRAAGVARVAARILTTVTEVDARLEAGVTRIAELRAEAAGWRQTVGRAIFWASVAGYLVLGWVAAGQLALVRAGWRGVRRSGRPPTSPPAK